MSSSSNETATRVRRRLRALSIAIVAAVAVLVVLAWPASPPDAEAGAPGWIVNATNDAVDANSPLKVGSLLEYAVERKNPVYPASARQLRQTGVVRVELVVDENGQVAEVQNLSGPTLLQSAARDAVKKWKFKPFTRDGQPVKATGFVSFNFNL